MNKKMILAMAILVLMVYGCDKSEEPNPTKTTTETTTEKIAEEAKASAGEMKEKTQFAADKAEDSEKQTESVAKEAVEESKELVASEGDKTKEIAHQSVEVARDEMSETKQGAKMAADEAANQVKQTFSPETIVLEASYGNITFPHAQHSDTFECSTCHGDTAPGPFDLDKNSAHDLCRDCHKQKGLGPTDCKGCHKK